MNTGHLLGIALLVGSVIPMDLRLLRVCPGPKPAATLAFLRPVVVAGPLVAAAFGVLLFVARAEGYAGNPWFRAKMAFLTLAIANAVLHLRLGASSRAAQASAAVSLLLWPAVLFCGCMIGYSWHCFGTSGCGAAADGAGRALLQGGTNSRRTACRTAGRLGVSGGSSHAIPRSGRAPAGTRRRSGSDVRAGAACRVGAIAFLDSSTPCPPRHRSRLSEPRVTRLGDRPTRRHDTPAEAARRPIGQNLYQRLRH